VAISKRLRDWLLHRDVDASVRYRVLGDALGKSQGDPAVVRARKQIGQKGWAAQILSRQHRDGHWESETISQFELYRPKYSGTLWSMLALSDLGVNPKDPRIVKAAELYLRVYQHAKHGLGFPDQEICFMGNSVKMLIKFGRLHDPRVQKAIATIAHKQKKDGGWHCFRSSTGTLDGWEGMGAFAVIPEEERSPEVRRSIERGAEFYLERRLLNEGPTPYAPWLRLHFPVHYYYDFLVGLDFMTALGYGKDRRLRPALNRLERMRNRDGTWNLDALQPDSDDPNYPVRRSYYAMGFELPGRPSRMITAIALAVLKRAGR